MEMTIDEAIIQSRILLTIWEEGSESKLDNSPKAIETLIEITRKYQKIEQLIADYENEEWEQIAVYRIREIIDGNDD